MEPAAKPLTINPRFQGVPGIALGGYAAGLLAADWACAEASFRRPIPLAQPLGREESGVEERVLRDARGPMTIVRPAQLDLEPPVTVSLEESRRASRGFLGHHRHPCPGCFACGTARTPGDGLRLFAGPVPDSQVLACEWTPGPELASPDGSVQPPYVWSALDCPGIWSLINSEPRGSPDRVVSSRLVVRRVAPVPAFRPSVVVAWTVDGRGPNRVAAAAILSADGRVLAIGRHTLVAAGWGVPLDPAAWK